MARIIAEELLVACHLSRIKQTTYLLLSKLVSSPEFLASNLKNPNDLEIA